VPGGQGFSPNVSYYPPFWKGVIGLSSAHSFPKNGLLWGFGYKRVRGGILILQKVWGGTVLCW
jgi:hypothetical protein